ncbi:hypothetical protein [Paenirhodobacter populi]|uniref:hypothetical protein n=1 Tax=Paenirhodobacter populi TaxID=2306993 RepID=UPI000FE38CEF|nr:hypothetical protein [Sinirhodobacter populi]RWR06448.1 hypothetical protein D2T32_14175 [Sinirhodobacter populi]
MTRLAALLLPAALLLSACTLEGFPSSAPRGPDTTTAGTCFAVVSKAEDGSYAIAAGVGDGSPQPSAVYTRRLTAQQVDAAVEKEKQIMTINPECLTTYVHDRAAADPQSVAATAQG